MVKLAEDKSVFKGSGVSITSEGHSYLGAAVGTKSFVKNYAFNIVKVFLEELDVLTTIASSQPHAAYTALTHGLSSKWTYLSKTIPDLFPTCTLLPIEQKLHREFLPSITRQKSIKSSREGLDVPTSSPWRNGNLESSREQL